MAYLSASCLTIYLFVYSSLAFSSKIYLCIPINSVGFTYTKENKKWLTSSFNVIDKKFILKKIKTGWEWRQFGDKNGELCHKEINKFGMLLCKLNFGELVFNSGELRYTQTYWSGYVHGDKDIFFDTPFIEIGTCSPI